MLTVQEVCVFTVHGVCIDTAQEVRTFIVRRYICVFTTYEVHGLALYYIYHKRCVCMCVCVDGSRCRFSLYNKYVCSLCSKCVYWLYNIYVWSCVFIVHFCCCCCCSCVCVCVCVCTCTCVSVCVCVCVCVCESE